MTFNRQIQRTKQSSSPNSEPKKTPTIRQRNSNDPLSEQEVELLLSKIDKLQDHTLLLFGFSSGVRVSEVMFDHTAINQAEGYVVIWDAKKHVPRKIYLPDSVITALLRHWNETDKRSPKLFNISTKTAERIIQYWTSKVLNKRKSWHCVRHTYITLSAMKYIPISIVIANTGDRPSTILQYYTQLSPLFIREEVNKKLLYKTT